MRYRRGVKEVTKEEYEQILGHKIKANIKEDKKDIIDISWDEFSSKYCGLEKPDPNADVLEKLLCVMLCNPNEFDEHFTLEVSPPYSKNMKSYIDRLAQVINSELEKYGEISNLEKLQEEAYDFINYKKKTLEEVKEKANEFQDYFRFRLNMNENTLITKEKLDYVNNMVKLIDPITKRMFSRGKTFTEARVRFSKGNSRKFRINTKVHLYDHENERMIQFLYVDSVEDFKKNIERNNDHIMYHLLSIFGPTALFTFDKNSKYLQHRNESLDPVWKLKFEKCFSYMNETFPKTEERILVEDHV